MQTIQLLALTALLLNPLAALHAQQPSSPTTATVRDRLWIFSAEFSRQWIKEHGDEKLNR